MRLQLISYRCEVCGKFFRHWNPEQTKCCLCEGREKAPGEWKE